MLGAARYREGDRHMPTRRRAPVHRPARPAPLPGPCPWPPSRAGRGRHRRRRGWRRRLLRRRRGWRRLPLRRQRLCGGGGIAALIVFGIVVAVFAAAWAVPARRAFVKRMWREKVRRRGKRSCTRRHGRQRRGRLLGPEGPGEARPGRLPADPEVVGEPPHRGLARVRVRRPVRAPQHAARGAREAGPRQPDLQSPAPRRRDGAHPPTTWPTTARTGSWPTSPARLDKWRTSRPGRW